MTTLLYEKPQALLDLRTDAHGIIAASAGTGKTYTLQHLVVEILLADSEVRLDEILLVTFTVAATSDLKAKIRDTLETLIRQWEVARAADLGQAYFVDGQPQAWVDDEIPETHWAIDLEGVNRLRHGLRNFDRAAIYTIHGFCQRILVEHAFANRRLFEQEHVSESDVIDEAFAQMLRRQVVDGSVAQRWLTAYLGAGHDIGNLRDGLAAYVGCTGEYRPVETIDLEAFSAFVENLKAGLEGVDVAQWKTSIKADVRAAEGPTVRTSNAVGDRMIILQEQFLPRVSDDNPVANLFLLNDVFAKKFDYFEKDGAQVVLNLAGELGDALRGIEDFRKNCELLVVHHLGELLAAQVEALKTEEGYFTFNDMVRVVRDTLADEGETGHLLANLREQFCYGLIDEFQDTDPMQWEIFSRIFVDSPRTDRHFLYLIGDPKQAIYGFRGGDVYTYLDACQSLRKMGAKTTALTDNYRSTPAVIDSYNAIFDAQVDNAIDLGNRIKYEENGVNPGKSWLSLKINEENSKIGLTAFDLVTDSEEVSTEEVRRGLVEQYAEEIRRIVDGEKHLEYPVDDSQQEWATVGAEDIYVLCRRRADLGAMATALRARGVPFAFLKMPGLFETDEVGDIYDLLLALDDPHDGSRVARAWMTPFFDLGLADLENLAAGGQQTVHYEQLLEWSRRARDGDFGRLFNQILAQSGLIRRRLLLERGERRLTNYLHLFEILAAEATRQVQTVADLAARLKAFMDGRAMPEGEDAEQQRLETEEAAVQLLTIHGSKGLQRGLVFVVPRFSGINRRNPPFAYHEPAGAERGSHSDLEDSFDASPAAHRRVEWHDRLNNMAGDGKARYLAEAAAEELRLAYVAITRAELMVYLPYAAEDSPIRQNRYISGDPFMEIMARLDGLDGSDERLQAVAQVVTPIDIPRLEPSFEEVRAQLSSLELDASSLRTVAIDAPGQDGLNEPERARQRAQLMARRWEITSYSKLKKRGATVSVEAEKSDPDPATGELPGGMATGNFIHLVLEELDYQWPRAMARSDWLEDDEVRTFFERRARRFGRFDEAAISRAMALVYDTLAAPVIRDDEPLCPALWTVDEAQMAREREFLFPVPEEADDGYWHKTFRSGAEIHGGFVTGFIDLLFEVDDKIYFADWKSDLAPPYDQSALTRLVNARYGEQAGLYSLAVCRMLGIDDRQGYEARFGGFFYFFARGMDPKVPGRGIFGGRLSWEQLQRKERSLFAIVDAAKIEDYGSRR